MQVVAKASGPASISDGKIGPVRQIGQFLLGSVTAGENREIVTWAVPVTSYAESFAESNLALAHEHPLRYLLLLDFLVHIPNHPLY